MRILEIFKKKIAECSGLIEFLYNGKDGNIDPYFHKDGTYSYLLYFDGNEQTVYSIDDAMNTPFINGKSITELENSIEILE